MNPLILAAHSIVKYLDLVSNGSLYLNRKRVDTLYKIERASSYRIFRETVSRQKVKKEECVLVVGFRLKFIGVNPVAHYLFERFCILTTPFWSGFRGFSIKLWMVDPKSRNYLGIYRWYGKDNAQVYADALVKILNIVSVKKSVWYRLYKNENFENYLASRIVN